MEKLYNDSYLRKTSEFIGFVKKESYSKLSINDSSVVLELGCGNGYDAIELSKLVGENGFVYGVDVDEKLITSSKNNALEQSRLNVEFILANAEQLPFKNEMFDSIRCERVFQHLKKPEEVIAEAYRVLKDKGVMLLVETDWDGMDIYIDNYEIAKKITTTLTGHVLNNGMASRKLTDYCQGVGFKNINLAVYPVQVNSYQVANELVRFDSIVEAGLAANVLTEKDCFDWRENIEKVVNQNRFMLTANIVLVWCTK